MLQTCKNVVATPERGVAVVLPGSGAQLKGHRDALKRDELRQGLGVEEWEDGSIYEGEFLNGLKHGKGKYTWGSGEYYEGSFYKDYRHGDGLYCWPTGHKFTGKFYLNRKEGYGHQQFPDGGTFQGLYHCDKRFGPGVLSYPDGRKDVGLWVGERLLKLCAPVEEGFSLKNFAGYAAYVDPVTAANCPTQPATTGLQTEGRTNKMVKKCSEMKSATSLGTDELTPHPPQVDANSDLLSDDNFILPSGIESYSTAGDHLPLPPGRRRELDQLFYGEELWEPDGCPHQGYERDPLSALPLQARMQAHIQKHRLQADIVGWDVGAILSLNRDSFGPKGPLEVHSGLLIQHASRGELKAVSQILRTGLVHPDVADSQGHTALIAATVNCHNDVIHFLLDMGADVDKLNCEGMSALAVCHVLYYPFHCLHPASTEPPTKTQVLESHPAFLNNPLVSPADFTADMPKCNSRAQSANTMTAEELTQHSSEVSTGRELITERQAGPKQPDSQSDGEHLQDEERGQNVVAEKEGGGKGVEREGEVRERQERSLREDERVGKGEERETESPRVQARENEQSEVTEGERESEERESTEEVDERRDTEVNKENLEERERVEGDVRGRVEMGSAGAPGVERSIQVLDGHIALGSVQWRDRRATASGRAQSKDKGRTPDQIFDCSTCSVSSYDIEVTEEAMQLSAEALSRTGAPQSSDTQETVRRMAALKTEHRARLNTLKLLLERGADPNVSRVPMPVLFLAIMAGDTEAVRRLLLCGARTDVPLPPERKGLYPLHVAAALPGPAGPMVTEFLLHAITDPDARACDHDEIFKPDEVFVEAQEPGDTNHLKNGGRTALHVVCQRDSDYQNASKTVALLLSHGASTDLLWSGHSPLSLAIATGNDLAVEVLLNGGANPNIPLGGRVRSALCALANIHYHLGGNRAKLLDMLVKAGADILMPVMVGDVVGTAVDYAYYSFNQDLRIANTPFHALNMRERETFKERRQLLGMMGDLLRQTIRQRENLEKERGAGADLSDTPTCLPPIPESQRKPVFQFCYQCGRSVSVKLTPCSRCNKVFYCSRTCKLTAWNERHKEECNRVSASPDGVQKSVTFKSQRAPRPLSVKLNSQTVPEPLGMAENVNLKENYSCI